MSLIWNYLEGGASMPSNQTWGQRLGLWWGRRLALRHGSVEIPPSCRIHPESRIHARKGHIRFGEKCTVAAGAIVQGNVTLGDNCSVQLYSILIGYGSCENPDGAILIGNNVRIAPQVMMIAANHNFADPSRPICEQGLTHGCITIGDDVWIAGRVIITAGVTIGRGSVIGAGAVVTRDIPPYSIAVGSPAKCIRSR